MREALRLLVIAHLPGGTRCGLAFYYQAVCPNNPFRASGSFLIEESGLHLVRPNSGPQWMLDSRIRDEEKRLGGFWLVSNSILVYRKRELQLPQRSLDGRVTMREYCGKLDYLYRLLGRMTTDQGKTSVIDGIREHRRGGHEGKSCPDE
jgi:hypothetical protein